MEKGKGFLEAEVGREKEKGSWGAKITRCLLPRLCHGGSTVKEKAGTFESDRPGVGFQPPIWVLLHFTSPVTGGGSSP